MKFPESEGLGFATGADGKRYHMDFYGEDEGAAVIIGPVESNTGVLNEYPEVHREDATDADDAFAKLSAWMKTNGWPPCERQKEHVLWTAPSAAEQAAHLRAKRECR